MIAAPRRDKTPDRPLHPIGRELEVTLTTWLVVYSVADINHPTHWRTHPNDARRNLPSTPDRVRYATPADRIGTLITMIPDLHDRLLALVPSDLLERSGRVFYSGRAAFTQPAPLYLLGLNPGGNPIEQATETIGSCIANASSRPAEWSAYVDDTWRGRTPGSRPLQRRVQHLLRQVGLDPRSVPAANVVFVRSRRESDLEAEKARLLQACWPVHHALIAAMGVRVIACLGGTAGRWVRERLGAGDLIDSFTESNDRHWKSQTHVTHEGLKVVTLTHPSIADWCSPATDPTVLVARALGRTVQAA